MRREINKFSRNNKKLSRPLQEIRQKARQRKEEEGEKREE